VTDAQNREITAMFLREPSHILILLLVLVLLFGAKRLPDSARSLAKSLRIFKSEMKEINKDEKKPDDEGGLEK
jgi:sec-independent protein translocase protein TatA